MVDKGASVSYTFQSLVGPTVETADDLEDTLQAGDFPLCVASRIGDSQIVEFLLDKGAHVDQSDADGRTSLHLVR
jgi:ankyrin repeat protein